MAVYLKKLNVKGLSFSFRDGFRCDNYGFFEDLPFIEMLTVPRIDPAFEFGVMPVSSLTGLRRLDASFKVVHPIDLARLPALRSCTLKWQNRLASVFDTKHLERLQISSLDWQKADGLANLRSLTNLDISHSGLRSFAPIAELRNLKRLSLAVCHSLDSLDGIENLQNLRCLHLVETHKITSLDCLSALRDLEVLTIADGREIQSVAPLGEMKNLKALWIAGVKTTIVDGDLTPLTRLPRLAMLNLGNRRHYSHRVIKKWDWSNIECPDTQLEPA
jgi:Leucine-rich repeat (LRR) protein